MKRIVVLLCAFSLLVAACAGKAAVSTSSGEALSPSGAGGTDASKQFPPRHRVADHQVIVMLGPEYANRPAVLDAMTSEYGLAGAGGMTVKLLYPESFKVSGITRISVLAERAAESGMTIIVTVGAPENTVTVLNKIHAVNPAIKIVNLFPLDDALSVEAVSDIVADYPAPKEILSDENAPASAVAAAGSVSDASIGLLILASALAEEGPAVDAPEVRLAASLEMARSFMKMKKSDIPWNIARWIDPDTGLKSRNHLLLESRGGSQE